jgi:hypothetical protein
MSSLSESGLSIEQLMEPSFEADQSIKVTIGITPDLWRANKRKDLNMTSLFHCMNKLHHGQLNCSKKGMLECLKRFLKKLSKRKVDFDEVSNDLFEPPVKRISLDSTEEAAFNAECEC